MSKFYGSAFLPTRFLPYDTSVGLDGNIDMLKLIRERAVNLFDKFLENAIGFFYEDTLPGSEQNRWHTLIIQNNPYQMDNMADVYNELVGRKQTNLQKLVKQFSKLPE